MLCLERLSLECNTATMIFLWLVLPAPLQALILLSLLTALGSALQPQTRLPARRRVVARAVARVEVCTKKHCKKKGSLKLLRIFEALAPDDVEVLAADMSHTEHGCFDECTMGPNVRVDGAGPKADGGPIVNGVRGAAGAAEVLCVDIPDGFEVPPP